MRDRSTLPLLISTVVALVLGAWALRSGPSVWADTQRGIDIIATLDGFDVRRIAADPGETLEIELTNASLGSHDIVFELEAGRIERLDSPIGLGRSETLTFDAPAEDGFYVYYSSVGDARERGYSGVLVVGDVDTVTVNGFNYAFEPDMLNAEAGAWLDIVFSSTDGFHDMVFVLEGDRIEASERVSTGGSTNLTFKAPETAGRYVYYCSVGRHRELGMEGSLVVSDGATATEVPTEVPTSTPTEVPPTPPGTEEPRSYDVVLDGLDSPHGLWIHDETRLLVSEGGTGDRPEPPPPFVPGNGDGRVFEVDLTDLGERRILIDGMTNSVDPGGGVVGANHTIALAGAGGSAATGTAGVALIAQAGGPGHLRPEEAAKVLRLPLDAEEGADPAVLADTLEFETLNNPDGFEPPDGIDSNPWRLVPGVGDDAYVYVVDAGANDILKLDPSTGDLSVWAVFGPLTEDGSQQPIPSGMAFLPAGGTLGGFPIGTTSAAVVALLGGFAPPDSPGYAPGQVRLLIDLDGNGDALGEGENVLLADDVFLPADIALGEAGLFVAELGRQRIARASDGALREFAECWIATGGVGCDPLSATSWQPVVPELSGVTALLFGAEGDLFATADLGADGAMSVRPDSVVRIPADRLEPPDVTPTPGPTETPPEPTPVPTPGIEEAEIFLPFARR